MSEVRYTSPTVPTTSGRLLEHRQVGTDRMATVLLHRARHSLATVTPLHEVALLRLLVVQAVCLTSREGLEGVACGFDSDDHQCGGDFLPSITPMAMPPELVSRIAM